MPPNRRAVLASLRALEDATELALPPPDKRIRELNVAIGDPQAPLGTFLEILDRNGLLGEEGRLRPEVGLVSMGDHFDWGKTTEREEATADGTSILSWLAAHPPDQVQIVIGNHDLVRVGELSELTDEEFLSAREAADVVCQKPQLRTAFLAKYPMLASAEALSHDFACFEVKQRLLVTLLLKKRRARLAVAAAADLLLVHAGLTDEELTVLGVEGKDATAIAAALNRFLDKRVGAWTGGPLDLRPLHQAGSAKHGEAKGILLHRPANPAIKRVDRASGRFDPRTLPRNICQVIGHVNDKKCRELLGDWAASPTPVLGKIRGMKVFPKAEYRVGCEDGDALIFIDGAMNQVAPADYELFDLQLRQPFAVR